jgi:TolA-binding protein
MGLISFNNGDLNSAIKNYKTVFNHNPTSNEAQEALGALEEIYIQELAAPDDYFAFVESIPGYEVSEFRRDSVRFRTAEIQYENAEYSKAVNSFAVYLEKFPTGINRLAAHYYSAESYGILKEYDNALQEYDAVVKKNTSKFYLKALTKAASLSYHYQQDFSRAYEYYAQLTDITTDPKGKFDAELGMMRSAYRNEKWTDAKIAGTAVLNYPDATKEEMSEAHYCVAKSSYDTNQLDDALNHFNEVTKYSNNALTAESRYLMASIYYQRKQLDLAEQMTHNANADNSNYPFWVGKGLILLSDIYVSRKDYFNAKAPLEALIENFQGEGEIITEAREKLSNVQQLEEMNSRLKADSDTIELDVIDDRDGNN